MTDPVWRKSSFSSGNGGNCVEVAFLGSSVGVRDSKNPNGPTLSVGAGGLATLVAGVKTGRLGR